MKKVLITGAKGMLGQDLSPVLEDEGFNVIETGHDAFDILNVESCKAVLEREKPDVVVHCAAYTLVDKAEEDSKMAFEINGKGSENIAKLCGELDIEMVYVSTDYVFNGEKTEPYEIDDETNPINVYGKSKLAGELAVRMYCRKSYIVRTSWLYGHYGKNFVETMIKLAENKKELKVVNDQIGCPTWTVDLAQGIANLIKDRTEYGIYHICGGEKASWYEFAKEIFKLTGQKVSVEPCTSEEFKTLAKRPKFSVMNNCKSCRNWKSALKDYINLR